jgi:hypothetical protein
MYQYYEYKETLFENLKYGEMKSWTYIIIGKWILIKFLTSLYSAHVRNYTMPADFQELIDISGSPFSH